MSEEKYEPMKEIREATLCLHCIHKPICIIKKETNKFEEKWYQYVYGLSRLLSQMAETCKFYKRVFECKMNGVSGTVHKAKRERECKVCTLKCEIKGLI